MSLASFMAKELPEEVDAVAENEPIPEPEKPTPLYPINKHSIALLLLQNADGSFDQSDKLDQTLSVENLNVSILRIALSTLLFGKAPTDEQKKLFTTAFVTKFLTDEETRLNSDDGVVKIEEAKGKDAVEVRSWPDLTKLADTRLGVSTSDWKAKAEAFMGDKVSQEWHDSAAKVAEKVAKKIDALPRSPDGRLQK